MIVQVHKDELFQMLGKYALPPWKDEHGNLLGGGVDCAPLARELEQAVDDIAQPARPNLGLATNAELVKELAVRWDMGSTDAGYRTVGGDD